MRCPSFVFTGVLYMGEISAQRMDDFRKAVLMDRIFNFYAGNVSMYFSDSLKFYTSDFLTISFYLEYNLLLAFVERERAVLASQKAAA